MFIDYVVRNLLEFPGFETNAARDSFHSTLLAFVRRLSMDVDDKYVGSPAVMILEGF